MKPDTAARRIPQALLTQLAARARAERPTTGSRSLPGPLDAASLARAESDLGFPLPPLLAALYERVADGGFGPEYGLLSLYDDLDGENGVVPAYLANLGDPEWPWPAGVLPISHWGCGMYACVDTRSPDLTVLLFEPNPGDPDLAWYVDSPSLEQWLRTWLDGTGWYADEDGAAAEDLRPWTDYHARVGADAVRPA
jgi:hypothetical protein